MKRIEEEKKAKQQEEEAKKKEEQKTEKRKKYQKWLSDNGYIEGEEFSLKRDEKKIIMYKKVSEFVL